MARPPQGKINVTRIDKNLLFKGEKGTYLNFVVFPNKNGKGQFGDTHFIVQDATKEQRDAGVKGPIIGSFTLPEDDGGGAAFKPSKPPPQKPSRQAEPEWDESSIPF